MTHSTKGGHHLKSMCLLIISCFCLWIQPAAMVHGEEYSCEVESNGTCVVKVKWHIPERYADEGRPFTLFYTSTERKPEKAAVLYYLGFYYCEAAEGHSCDVSSVLNLTGLSVTTCVDGVRYRLAADGEPGVPCKELPTQSHTNSNRQNESNSYNKSHLTQEGIIGVSVGVAVSVSVLAAAAVYVLMKVRTKEKVYFNTNQTSIALLV